MSQHLSMMASNIFCGISSFSRETLSFCDAQTTSDFSERQPFVNYAAILDYSDRTVVQQRTFGLIRAKEHGIVDRERVFARAVEDGLVEAEAKLFVGQ
jgi:hypothetical protein